jgi:polysaccharide export outer membrane protein
MSRSRFILGIVALLLLTFGAPHSVSSASAAPRAQVLLPKPSGSPLYLIQPGDILEISVWKAPDVSRNQVLVRPDGRIAIALAQDVQAAGLNPTQLKEKLEEMLKDYLPPPVVVTVIVSAIQSYRVYVTGNVGSSGEIVAASPLSVLQAISKAGGFKQFAKQREIVIIRGDGENTKRFTFNHDEVIGGTNFSQNFPLKNGDVVFVP